MNEEELEQLLANSRMQGSSSPGWGAAAGAAASVQNRPTLPKPGDYVGSNLSFLDWLAGTYENRSYNEGIVQGWFNPQYYRKQYEDMSIAERIIFDQEWVARQDPGAYFFNKIKKLAPFPLSLLPDVPQGTPHNVDNPPPVEDALPSNVRGNPITVLPEHPGYPEPSPGNPHKDKPVDFNFFDWLNENLPPLEPAKEIPDYEPLDYEPFERSPPSWLTRDDYITDLDAWNDAKPVFDYPDELRPGSSWFPAGASESDPRVIRYNELMPPYRSAAEAFSKEEQDWFDKGPDSQLYDMSTYLGESVDNRMKAESLRDAGYSPGPDFGWEGDPSAANKEFEEFRKQQEFAERSHREDYDAMVADMVETERLRQEEYAAEQQRYTDKYNENPYFYDNLLSGGGSSEYAHRLDPSVGQPIIPVDSLISQEEIILNQTRPGGGIGLSEQIINQAKPGAYIYPPGMLN